MTSPDLDALSRLLPNCVVDVQEQLEKTLYPSRLTLMFIYPENTADFILDGPLIQVTSGLQVLSNQPAVPARLHEVPKDLSSVINSMPVNV